MAEPQDAHGAAERTTTAQLPCTHLPHVVTLPRIAAAVLLLRAVQGRGSAAGSMDEEAEDGAAHPDLAPTDGRTTPSPPSTPPTADDHSPFSRSTLHPADDNSLLSHSTLHHTSTPPSLPTSSPVLRRVLGWPQLVSLGIGCTIGAGIFVVTGKVAREQTGPSLFLAYIVSGIACLCCAFCYAEFAAMSPSAGSAYSYARATMGEIMGWVIGWDLILEYTVAASAVAKGWSENLNELLTLMGIPLPPSISTAPLSSSWGLQPGAAIDLPAVFISLSLTFLLARGVKESAAFNSVMVLIKVSLVLLVIVVGAVYVNPANYSPFMPFGFFSLSFFGNVVYGQTNASGDAVGVVAGAAIIYFSYIGFDAVSCQAEECKDPQRDLPRGIIGSLVVSTALYVAASLVLVGLVPYDTIDVSAPFSKAFRDVGVPWAEGVVAFGALTGITSVLLVTMMGQPRITLAMARDGLLPPSFFAYVHPVYQTPFKATCLTGALVATTSGLIPLSILVELVSIGTLFAFTLVCVSVLILRRTRPHHPRPFRVPYSPYIPTLGATMCLLLMLSLPSTNWLRLIVWLAVGLVVYGLYGRKRGMRRRGGEYELGRVTDEGDGEEGTELEEEDESHAADEVGGAGAAVKEELRHVRRILAATMVEMSELVTQKKSRKQGAEVESGGAEVGQGEEEEGEETKAEASECDALAPHGARGEEEEEEGEVEEKVAADLPPADPPHTTTVEAAVPMVAASTQRAQVAGEAVDRHERAIPSPLHPLRSSETGPQ